MYIHAAHSFSGLNNAPLYTCNKFVDISFMDIWVFHLMAILSSAAITVGVQVFVRISAFKQFGYIPRDGIARSQSNYVFNFWRSEKLFQQWLHHFTLPTAIGNGTQLAWVPISSYPWQCYCCHFSHCVKCEIVSSCDFDTHFPCSFCHTCIFEWLFDLAGQHLTLEVFSSARVLTFPQ